MASSGNFATWNVLAKVNPSLSYAGFILDKGNTRFRGNTGGTSSMTSTLSMTSGKWYVEIYAENAPAGGWPTLGLLKTSTISIMQNVSNYQGYTSATAPNRSEIVGTNGNINAFGSTSGASVSGSAWADGDVLQIAVDIDAGKWWFGKNNTYFNSGNPAAGSGQVDTFTAGTELSIWTASYNGSSYMYINAGQDSSFSGNITAGGNADDNGFGDFKYAPPSGFLALCTGNLPISADIDPAQTDDDYSGTKQFNAIKYVGNGGSSSNNITYGFKPDLVWGKDLDGIGGGYSPHVWDTTRGDDYYMYSNGTAASTTSGSDYVEFTSTGIKIDESWDGINKNGANYISFGWRANGGTTSTNNEGNHTSTVQANTVGGFSIISYANYTSSSGVTLGHGLNQAPDLYIHKSTANTSNWHIYHHSLGATKALVMNSLAGEATAIGYWANTEPTADVLSLGNTLAGTGAGIVYAWHEVPGLSKFGKYTGLGNNDGTYIDLGFRPKMLWIKRSSSASITYGWNCFIDSINDNVNKAQFKGWWLDQYVGASSNYPVDFVSTGFKHRNNNANLDATGVEYVYMAWADTPAKYSVAF